MTSVSKVDLLGLGIAPVDFFMSVDRHPACGLKIDAIPESGLIAHGGPVPTALCTFSRMGGSASLITSFGDDHWADFSRKELGRFGVAHNLCLVRKNCPSALASAWIHRNTGERTIVLDMSPRLYIRPRDINLSILPRARLVHLDGRHIEACLKLARWAKKIGAAVMLDVGSVRNPVDDLFPFLDYLICADTYACNYFHTRSIETAARKFAALGIPEVVVTSGIRGSFGLDADGRGHRQRAFRVAVVDATGAGDVFHGGYLYGLFKGWDLGKKMAFASAAAALKCRRRGARDGIPSRRQTLNFMRTHGAYHA